MTYSASLDTLSKILTAIVIAGFLAIYFFLKDTAYFSGWFFFIVAIFVLSYLLRPVRYELEANQLIIYRLIKPVVIERADVSAATFLPDEDRKGILRTFGSGGFFGYFGYFWSKRLGRFTMQATRRDNLVLIEKKDGKKIVISPDDENFISVLKRQWRLG